MNDIIIRQETEEDYPFVFEVIRKAFLNEPLSDQQEPYLVERLRKSEAFVPELSLVAEKDKQVVGQILLTKVCVKDKEKKYDSLALAPVSVAPEYQHQGIGGMLISKAHTEAQRLGFSSVILLGHAEYYPRFGYRPASLYGIYLPFEVPDDNCMAIELKEKALESVSGVVEYPRAFFG